MIGFWTPQARCPQKAGVRYPIGLLLGALVASCASTPRPCPYPERAAPPTAKAALPAAPVPDLAPLLKSVVQIKVKVDEQIKAGQLAQSYEYGTGFFVDERGRILTSAHVLAALDDPRDLSVHHQGRELQARVLRIDRESDLAVLLVDAGETVSLEISDRPVRLGEPVFAVGYPFVDVFTDAAPAVSVGHVAGAGRDIQYAGRRVEDLLLTDAFVADGCSGGPLLDISGKVIGVLRFNLARRGAWLGLSFAQPIGSFRPSRGGSK